MFVVATPKAGLEDSPRIVLAMLVGEGVTNSRASAETATRTYRCACGGRGFSGELGGRAAGFGGVARSCGRGAGCL